jgi:hypothetical protein
MTNRRAREWCLEHHGKRVATLFLAVEGGQNYTVFEMRPECDSAELAAVLMALKNQSRNPDAGLVMRSESDGMVMNNDEFTLSPAMILTYYPHAQPARDVGAFEKLRNWFFSQLIVAGKKSRKMSGRARFEDVAQMQSDRTARLYKGHKDGDLSSA